jgi:hypothetical protein
LRTCVYRGECTYSVLPAHTAPSRGSVARRPACVFVSNLRVGLEQLIDCRKNELQIVLDSAKLWIDFLLHGR